MWAGDHGWFAASVSWFGITDLTAFHARVPRFQRHHTDHLVGPWPEASHVHWGRSSVHNADHITRPILANRAVLGSSAP